MSEDDNVTTLIIRLHGQMPRPPRLYLTRDDVSIMMTRAGYLCQCSTHDLDLSGYPYKWVRAVEAQVRNPKGLNYYNSEFWQNARLAFIELGGLLKGQESGRG